MSDKERYPAGFGDNLPSVTTILGAFPGPQLLAWYKRMAFAEQKVISEKSLDIGKTLHELRIRIEKGEPLEIVTKYPEEMQNCIKAYLKWKKEREIPPIVYSELRMYSKDLGYRGTCDDIAGNRLKLILLEHKTSSGIYDDALEQVVAYKKLFESPDTQFLDLVGNSKSRKISSAWVTRFPKDKPDFETRMVRPEEEWELFESFSMKLRIFQIRKKREAQWRLEHADDTRPYNAKPSSGEGS